MFVCLKQTRLVGKQHKNSFISNFQRIAVHEVNDDEYAMLKTWNA